jgi:hypothetical protein
LHFLQPLHGALAAAQQVQLPLHPLQLRGASAQLHFQRRDRRLRLGARRCKVLARFVGDALATTQILLLLQQRLLLYCYRLLDTFILRNLLAHADESSLHGHSARITLLRLTRRSVRLAAALPQCFRQCVALALKLLNSNGRIMKLRVQLVSLLLQLLPRLAQLGALSLHLQPQSLHLRAHDARGGVSVVCSGDGALNFRRLLVVEPQVSVHSDVSMCSAVATKRGAMSCDSLLHFSIRALRDFGLPPGHFRGKVPAALDVTLGIPQRFPQQPHLQQQRLTNLHKNNLNDDVP